MKHFLHTITLLAGLTAAGSLRAQCTAAFTCTNAGNVFTFTDASTASSGTISSWIWTFGDLSAPSNSQNPQHTYTACGQYVVTLNIITSAFCTSSFTDTILVNGGTNPAFTASVDTTTGTVTFQAQPASPLLTYAWDFGDSGTGTGIAATHTYANAGVYNVCLIVADTGGICSDTFCSQVTVTIAPPSCNATFTNTTFANVQTFNATPVNINWTYTWDFGDGSPLANGVVTTHSYTTPGTYTVCLTVTDSSTSCSSTFCDTVIIPQQSSCPVTFTNINLGLTETFTATPLSLFNTYSWDFGDGSPLGSGTVTTHTYTSPGTYTVCVTMTTPQNCTSSFCDTVIIQPNGIHEYDASALAVSVYPNPAQTDIAVSFLMPAKGDAAVLVYDIAGKEILQMKVLQLAAGKQEIVIPVSSLASGSYLLRIRAGDVSAVTRLIRF